jgi:hypothetical protein
MDLSKSIRPKAWERTNDGDVRILATYEPSEKRYVFPPLPGHLQSECAELRRLPSVGRLYSYTVMPANPKRGTPQRAFALVDYPDQDLRVFGRLQLTDDFRPILNTAVRVGLEELTKGEDYVFECIEEDRP